MVWSVALACVTVEEPGAAFRRGLQPEPGAAADLARRLYPGTRVTEIADTVLDFALWPFEDELFVGAYGQALTAWDRRRLAVDAGAAALAAGRRRRVPRS